MELKLEFSSARNWISGLRGHHCSVENQRSCGKGKNPSTSREASSSKKGPKKSHGRYSRHETCCGNSSKGKAEQRGSEFEELSERLKVLEEETELMKEAFFWSLEERKAMMNEIFKQFQLLHGCLKPRNMVTEQNSILNPFEDWRVRNILPEILDTDQNPPLITRELRANNLAFQEHVSFGGHIKCHRD